MHEQIHQETDQLKQKKRHLEQLAIQLDEKDMVREIERALTQGDVVTFLQQPPPQEPPAQSAPTPASAGDLPGDVLPGPRDIPAQEERPENLQRVPVPLQGPFEAIVITDSPAQSPLRDDGAKSEQPTPATQDSTDAHRVERDLNALMAECEMDEELPEGEGPTPAPQPLEDGSIFPEVLPMSPVPAGGHPTPQAAPSAPATPIGGNPSTPVRQYVNENFRGSLSPTPKARVRRKPTV